MHDMDIITSRFLRTISKESLEAGSYLLFVLLNVAGLSVLELLISVAYL